MFKRYLATSGMSEDEYVMMIKRMLGRKLLITDLVSTFNIPDVLIDAIFKMDNQRRSFKYVVISPDSVKIERQISNDEIEQYFADFSSNFVIAEKRDADVLFIPNEVILKKYVLTDELVRDYFEQNKKDLDQPEKREVLQMVFLNKESAEKAFEKIKNGANFDETAKEFEAENSNSPTLGVVSYEELAEGLADDAFELAINDPKIVQVADSWQVIMIKEILPAKKAVFEDLKPSIEQALSDENLYDALRNARADIDDAISAGKSLDQVAEDFGVKTVEVKDIAEENVVENISSDIPYVKSLDFNEVVFSYGLNEVSSAEEFDEGLVVIEVKKIADAHLPEIDTVKDEIISLWTIQEKNAIAKEIAENIMVDIEEDGDIISAAKARGFETFRSEPISRNETFAGLNRYDINDLFLTENNNAKIYEKTGNNFVIAVPFETVNFKYDTISEEDKQSVALKVKDALLSDMFQSMLKAYGDDLSIEIDYKRAGFSE